MRQLGKDEVIKEGDLHYAAGYWFIINMCPRNLFIGATIGGLERANKRDHPFTKFSPIIILRPNWFERIFRIEPKNKEHKWEIRKKVVHK